jgi:hypothetical protein
MIDVTFLSRSLLNYVAISRIVKIAVVRRVYIIIENFLGVTFFIEANNVMPISVEAEGYEETG